MTTPTHTHTSILALHILLYQLDMRWSGTSPEDDATEPRHGSLYIYVTTPSGQRPGDRETPPEGTHPVDKDRIS